MKFKNIYYLSVLVLFFVNYVDVYSKPLIFTIADATGKKYKLSVLENVIEQQLLINLISNKVIIDSILLIDVMNFEPSDVLIEQGRFLCFRYSSRGGSGIKFKTTIYFSVSRDKKLVKSLHLFSYYSHLVNNFYIEDKYTRTKKVHEEQKYELKFKLSGPPYVLEVIEYNFIRSLLEPATNTEQTKIYKLTFDTTNNVFFINKEEDNIFNINFEVARYLYRNQKWYFESFYGKYEEMK